jgi:hypothetical protein
MAGLVVPAIRAVGRIATSQTYMSSFMQAFHWSSATELRVAAWMAGTTSPAMTELARVFDP